VAQRLTGTAQRSWGMRHREGRVDVALALGRKSLVFDEACLRVVALGHRLEDAAAAGPAFGVMGGVMAVIRFTLEVGGLPVDFSVL